VTSAAAPGAGASSSDPPGRWKALTVLAVAVLLSMTTWFSATAVVPQLRAEWALGAAGAAWLTIAVQLGFVAGALVSAAVNLADLVPPHRLLLLGAAAAAAANAGLLVAGGLAAALPLRLATGAALALVYPPALKALATWFRRGRGLALGVLVGAITLGSATPHLVNGLGGLRWQMVVLATSALTLAGGVLAATVWREGPFPFPRAVFDPRQTRRAFADRAVRLATLGYFGHMWELYAMWAWFAVFATEVLAVRGQGTAATASLLTFAVIGVGAAGCVVGGVLGDRWGRTRLTVLAMSCSGAAALVIGPSAAGPLWLVVAVGVFWGFWVIADSAQFSAVVTETGDQRYVGTAVTLQLATGFTLTVATIWLVPVVQALAGWAWAFALLAPGPALGVVAMLRLQRSPDAARIAGGRG
jgi:MFS family permease